MAQAQICEAGTGRAHGTGHSFRSLGGRLTYNLFFLPKKITSMRGRLKCRLFFWEDLETGALNGCSHGLEHMNGFRNPVEQEQVERQIDTAARGRLRDWIQRQEKKLAITSVFDFSEEDSEIFSSEGPLKGRSSFLVPSLKG